MISASDPAQIKGLLKLLFRRFHIISVPSIAANILVLYRLQARQDFLVGAFGLATCDYYPTVAERNGKFDEWVQRYPNSYYSHLALGIYDEASREHGSFSKRSGAGYLSQRLKMNLIPIQFRGSLAFRRRGRARNVCRYEI
jgi:hypothetical protein